MQIPSDLTTWGLFLTGSSVAMAGSYVLGRVDALHRLKRLRATWVAVADHGPFGLEPADEFRSRTHAESYRRRLHDTEEITVMKREDWETEVLRRLRSDAFWDEIERIEKWVEEANARIRAANEQSTTVLPVVSAEPNSGELLLRLNEISADIAGLGSRIDRTDESLAETTRMMDAFREHIVHLDDAISDHTAKVGHITAEMKAITEDGESSRKNAPTKEFPRPTGPTMVRSPRGVTPIGRNMEKSGPGNELGSKGMEG